MEPVAEIPSPEAGDSETVVSLLETAAAFSAKGDPAEALSWLKRAASSAGEGANDARTLVLARSASSLSDRLRAPGALLGEAAPLGAASRTPKPPARRADEPPVEDVDGEAGDAEPILLSVRADKPVVSVRPPPPSSRAASAGATPAPPSSAAAAKSAPSVAPKSAPSGAVVAKSPPSVTPPSAAPKSAPARPAREPWRMRDAARVSIVKSSTEPGLYYVRVLEDGKRPFEGFEGLLVALDPESTLRP